MEKQKHLHIKDFPEDVKIRAKIRAAHRRITLREFIISVITDEETLNENYNQEEDT